jgi:rod shape-determining protein MreC
MALRNRTRSTRLLVVTLVSVSLLTITIDYRQGDSGPLAAIGSAALAIISPLQEAVSKVTHPIGNFFSTLTHLPSIRAENEHLRNQVADLESRLAIVSSNEDRVKELENLLQIQASLGKNVSSTGALVIANGVSNFEWTASINKGSSDGVKLDMPVVVGGMDATTARLIGHIVKVSPDYSIVQLIIDPDSAVAGRLEQSRQTGILTGQGGADLRMSLVDASTPVAPGELVTTAGYRIPGLASSLYPPGIVIGTVSRELDTPAALEKFVTVRPAVDFASLDYVLVILSSGSG